MGRNFLIIKFHLQKKEFISVSFSRCSLNKIDLNVSYWKNWMKFMIPVYWWEMSAKIEQRVLHIDFTFRICNLTIFIISASSIEKLKWHKSMTYKTNTKYFYIFPILLSNVTKIWNTNWPSISIQTF